MINYTIEPILHYPDNGKHLEVWTDPTIQEVFDEYDVQIRKGEDPYWYTDHNGEDRETKPQFWYVTREGEVITGKGVTDVNKAIKIAVDHLKTHLQAQLELLP